MITLVRYLCPACGATWRMLPVFVARMLWRTWQVVEAETLGPPPAGGAPRVPARTVRRWRARLGTAAAALVGVLREHGSAVLAAVAARVGEAATRIEFVLPFAEATTTQVLQRLAQLAATVHRLEPGVRLM